MSLNAYKNTNTKYNIYKNLNVDIKFMCKYKVKNQAVMKTKSKVSQTANYGISCLINIFE